MRLQRDQRGLEVRTYTDSGDDLEDDDLGPLRVRSEVDEKSEAERHHADAEPDRFAVHAGLFNEDPRSGGHEA